MKGGAQQLGVHTAVKPATSQVNREASIVEGESGRNARKVNLALGHMAYSLLATWTPSDFVQVSAYATILLKPHIDDAGSSAARLEYLNPIR